MDVFEYRITRSIITEGVFVALNTNTEMGGLFMRLKNLMVSEIHLLWDIAFLEQYSKDRRVPGGLRWDIHPQQHEVEVETWFRYFNEAGISLLVDRKRNRLLSIDKEIKEIKDKLLPHKSTPEYLSLSANLNSHLEKEVKDQPTKKQKKYACDANDYRNNLVFNWQKKDGGPPADTSGSAEMDISPPLDLGNAMAPVVPVAHDTHVTARKNVQHPTTPRNRNGPRDRNHIPNNLPEYGYQHPNRGKGNTQRGRGHPPGEG